MRSARGAWAEDGIVQQGHPQNQGGLPRDVHHHRRVHVRVHLATDIAASCAATMWTTTRRSNVLAKIARVATRAAGADMVAPSDMMDGRVAAIRRACSTANGLYPVCRSCPTPPNTRRPFTGRSGEAAGSAPSFGDRRSYQMDPHNGREAMREMRARCGRGRGYPDDQARHAAIST